MDKQQLISMLASINETAHKATMTGVLGESGPYMIGVLARVVNVMVKNQWIDEDTYEILDGASIIGKEDKTLSEIGVCASMLISTLVAQKMKDNNQQQPSYKDLGRGNGPRPDFGGE